MSDSVNIEVTDSMTGENITYAGDMTWENAVDLIRILPVGIIVELTLRCDPKCGIEIHINKASFSSGKPKHITMNLINIESDEYDLFWGKIKRRLMA